MADHVRGNVCWQAVSKIGRVAVRGLCRQRHGSVGVSVSLTLLAIAVGGLMLLDVGRAHLANARVARALQAGAKALAGVDAGPLMSDTLVVRHFYDNLPAADYGLALSVWIETQDEFRIVDVRTEVDTVVLRYIGRPRLVFRARGRVPSNVVWLSEPNL